MCCVIPLRCRVVITEGLHQDVQYLQLEVQLHGRGLEPAFGRLHRLGLETAAVAACTRVR